MRSEGKHEEAKLIKKAIMTTPTKSKRIKEAWSASKKATNIIAYSPAEALALMIESGLTKSSYQIIRT